MHWRVEAGVLAAGASLGRHLVVELVFDLHLAGLADLGEVQGDDHLPGFAVVDDSGGNFGKGVADLAGESPAIQFVEKFGDVCRFGHGRWLERALLRSRRHQTVSNWVEMEY